LIARVLVALVIAVAPAAARYQAGTPMATTDQCAGLPTGTARKLRIRVGED